MQLGIQIIYFYRIAIYTNKRDLDALSTEISFICNISEGADDEEGEADKEDGEVDHFGADVLLVEDEHSVEERNDHAATTDHRDNGDHRVGVGEGIEIGEVGGGKEQRDAWDAPPPYELLARTVDFQQHAYRNAHDDTLIERVPCLHFLRQIVAFIQQIFVVERTDGSKHHCSYRHPYPARVLERKTFLRPYPRDEIERGESEDDTYPLDEIEPLAEEQKGTYEHHHGTRGVDGTLDCERQMLDGIVPKNPRAKDDKSLKHYSQMTGEGIAQSP